MTDFLLERLQQASSSRGLLWVLAALGITISPSSIADILTWTTGAVGVLGVVAPDGVAKTEAGFDPVGYVVNRIKEGSTYRGLTWGVTSWGLSHGIDVNTLIPLAAGAVGTLGVLVPDAGSEQAAALTADPMGYLGARLREPSSYRSGAWLLAGGAISTGTLSLTTGLLLAAVVSGAVGLFVSDKRAPTSTAA